jgi:hypothetical protein
MPEGDVINTRVARLNTSRKNEIPDIARVLAPLLLRDEKKKNDGREYKLNAQLAAEIVVLIIEVNNRKSQTN